MTTQQKITMYQQIEDHGNKLNAIFNTGIDPVALCKKLRTLEIKANKLATDYCNGENGITSENWEEKITPVMQKVYTLLNNGKYNDDRPHQKRVPIFLNGDARGYALKINDSYVKLLQASGKNIYTDMGGYGILAPDFTPNN
jgi:hypothetical protein